MGLSIKGYVLEPPRVGASNSPFTYTPNDFIANAGAFNAAYPSNESASRTDYCVTTQTEGLLVNATFGFTKNEGTNSAVVRRFDYDALVGSFRPLPGSAPEVLGTLSTNSNTTRLKATVPAGILPAAPFRVSVGSGSGTTFPISLVASDGAFGSPGSGLVELSMATGNLNWNTGDLTTYGGQTVRYQRQSFFSYADSTGLLGPASLDLMLNPLPGPGQYPRIRFGYGFYLTPVNVVTEGGFSPDPAPGTVEWAGTTGRLKFNSGDLTTNTGKSVYYDGVLFSWKQPLSSQVGGTVLVPANIPIPEPGGDIIFRLASGYQFPLLRLVSVFDTGTAGEVQVRTTDGAVRFSDVDQATYGAAPVTVYFGDYAIERGISMRFFRSPVNRDASDPTLKDVTAIYGVTGATWASPIIQAPYVMLPATPIEDPGYPLSVYVEQGTGSYTGPLSDLNVAVPPVGLGYLLDYEKRQLYYAQRQANQIVTFSQRGGGIQLPNIPVRSEHLLLEIESAPGVGNFTALVQGQTMLFDPGPGIVTLTNQTGRLKAQGTGSFVGTTLTDPTASFVASGVVAGQVLVLPSGVQAGVYTVVSCTATTITTDLPPSVAASSTPYEVRTAPEVIADRYFQELVPVDPNTSLERIRALGTAQNQTVVLTGGTPAVFTASTTLEDTSVDFVVAGVLAGDTVLLTSGPDSGSYRRVTLVESTQLTVDRAFTSYTAANYRIERRLHVLPSYIGRVRVRLGLTSFATLVVQPTNAAFTAPGSLAAGTVEVSQQTGDLNFSSADVTSALAVFWGLRLRLYYDFKVSKDLGFIELTERLLTGDELYATYQPTTDEGVQPSVTEHVGFLIRKEVTQPWPRPAVTNQVPFNPAGRTVSMAIPPAVFRGGRPQDDTQIQVKTSPSIISFLPNTGFMTDALPSGSTLEPDERVMVDYYVYEAVGGERSFNVLQPPIYAAQVLIQAGSSTLTLVGDQTASFPANYLLRIELGQVYQIGSSTYDSGTSLTTVTLAYGTKFQDDFTNPKLYLSSGPIRLNPVFPFQPAYFTTELATFGTMPRGMPTFGLPGDLTLSYPKGTVVLFTDNLTFYDLYLVSGAVLKDGVTVVTLQQNVRQQYMAGPVVLKRSIRPVLEDGVTQTQLRSVPILTQGVTLYRRVEGQVGVLMQTPSDYTLDPSGTLQYVQPLQPSESLDALYTSYRMVQAGTRIRATYTSLVTPSAQNGLLGQLLKADYSLLSPDSFYYRVETLTNFSAEVLQALQASARSSSPSSGPTTSNASQPVLWEQGNPSLFFTEGHTANVDYVSRQYLKFFNDNTHRLEDVLQDEDGRVIGDINGRFRFDGLTGNPIRLTYSTVTNEIDDVFQVSPFPIGAVTPPWPPTVTYLGTNIPLYQQSAYSRLFPTQRAHLTALTVAGLDTGASSGDAIGDFRQPSMTSVPGSIYRRLPRGLTQKRALAGTTTLYVDNANGEATFNRPPFAVGMKVVIQNRDGTVLVSDAAPLTVTGVLSGPERIQVGALPVDIPEGATVFLCITGASADTTYWKTYRQGFDVQVNAATGQLIYVKPYWPFDGSVPLIPAQLCVQAPNSNEFLEMDGTSFLQLSKMAAKFPALYGEIGSDCNDQSIPVLSPTPEQEISQLQTEVDRYTVIFGSTTAPVTISNVSLDVPGTTLFTLIPFAAPLPQLYDVVTFTSGPNVGTGYRRVVAMGANSLTVDWPFPFPSSVGDIIVTAAPNVATGSATVAGTTLTDGAGLSGAIQPGHTVVFTSGLNIMLRRQVVAILTANDLQLDHGVPSALLTTYRVTNHLNSYSDWTQVITSGFTQKQVLTVNDHNTTPSVVDCMVLAITRFFEGDVVSATNGVLTDILTPASNAGTVTGSTLTGPGQDFVTAGVLATHLVYIESGTDGGFYPILSVDSATQITTTVPFPAAGAVTYRIVRVFGVETQALLDLYSIRAKAQTWSDEYAPWLAKVVASDYLLVPPTGAVDTNTYLNRMTTADLLARQAAAMGRLTDVTAFTLGTVPLVEAIVKSRDKLYDKRYAWIDARTNLDTGSLYVIQRAVANREAATEKLYNDLLKILSVQTV